ncbi:hypothetical protein LN378_13410 [Enterobacter hormaechei subsp. steigerwaltii]|nr:hypothetical protein [Enterobacter hormaechei subsp. steigerwaltii]DAQ42769.1 MAG TPA: hypothetical protein [Caudoviricetes sp.]
MCTSAGFSKFTGSHTRQIRSSESHVKFKISLVICQLAFSLDPFLILKTEKSWNSFQSFQFWFSAKPPALARSGGLVCRKIKLKNFYDPKTAGGCGVVRFWSAKDFFGRAVTRQRPAVGMICFKGGSECAKRLNAPERR